MAKVKPGWADKWVQRASVATDAYKTGVQNPRADWQAATIAGAKNWSDAIQVAIQKGYFAQGVQKAGTAKWQTGALSKGADRFASGVAAAKPVYEAKMAKVIAEIENCPLPARLAKGRVENYERVKIMGQWLNKAKLDGKFK